MPGVLKNLSLGIKAFRRQVQEGMGAMTSLTELLTSCLPSRPSASEGSGHVHSSHWFISLPGPWLCALHMGSIQYIVVGINLSVFYPWDNINWGNLTTDDGSQGPCPLWHLGNSGFLNVCSCLYVPVSALAEVPGVYLLSKENWSVLPLSVEDALII